MDAKVSLSSLAEDNGFPSADIANIHLIEDGQQVTGFDKLVSTARLNIVFRCPDVLRGHTKTHNYFESFGQVDLPD